MKRKPASLQTKTNQAELSLQAAGDFDAATVLTITAIMPRMNGTERRESGPTDIHIAADIQSQSRLVHACFHTVNGGCSVIC